MELEAWNTYIQNQKPVPARGNPWGTVAFVGEAPGEREKLFAMPFVGEAGRLLKRLLEQAGIAEEAYFLDNVCPFQPPGNDVSAIPEEALAEYSLELHLRLASLPNLNLIVPLGNTALVALTGKKGISKWRGSLLSAVLWDESGGERKIKMLPTFHPSFLLRSAGSTGVVLADLAKVKQEMASPKPVLLPPKRDFLIYPSRKQLEDFLWECLDAPLVSVDIESNMKTREIICVGIAPSPTLAMCVPWEKEYQKALLKSFLASPVAKTGHHAALFDNFWLSWFGAPMRNLTIDTMWLHHCLDPTAEHSLASIASLVTNEPYWKDEAIDPKEGTSVKVFAPSEATYLYNCKDTAVTHEIAGRLEEMAKQEPWEKEGERRGSKWDFYRTHYQALFPALLSMSLGGIRVDRQATQARYSALEAELKEIEARLETLAGESLVPNKALSRKKEAAFLYETLGLPKRWTKGKNSTGSRSLATDEETIRLHMQRNPKKMAEIGPLLLDHARKQKLSTFFSLSRMQEQEDTALEPGEKALRLHFTLKPSTGTGRLASSKSPFKTGSNAQNLDREARSIYLPEPGHLMLELDGSQVESRMCYMLTGDPELVRLANTKPWEFDAHKENAARIFNIPLSQVTKEQRYTAKIAVHSAQREGTGATLQKTFLKETGIFHTVAECQALIDSYFKTFPGVKNYFRSVQSQLFRERRLVNTWGRVITFPWERFSEDLFRQAYSFPMQSDCADWMNQQGVIPLYSFLVSRNMRSRLLLTVHDSLLISVHPEEAWEILSYIIPLLEAPVIYPAGPLVIPVEIALGRNWGEKAYEWKKPPSQEELQKALRALCDPSQVEAGVREDGGIPHALPGGAAQEQAA